MFLKCAFCNKSLIQSTRINDHVNLVLTIQHAVSYPCHGWTLRVRYRLIRFKVIFPDLWRHRQSKRIAQHHCVCLLHRLTWETSTRNSDIMTWTLDFLMQVSVRKVQKLTFNVAIILRMVLGFLVKRYFEVFGHFLPFLWCRMLEEGSQFYSELETVK